MCELEVCQRKEERSREIKEANSASKMTEETKISENDERIQLKTFLAMASFL
jgi:hypothetical protein